jgi:CRP/FNR family cyclic AMP-dependent transcriptional regulator
MSRRNSADLSPKWGLAIARLSDVERRTIDRQMRTVTLQPRRFVFRQGEPSNTLAIIRQGRVRLFQTSTNGQEFTTGVCVPGAILGLAAAVLDRPRILSAQALDVVVVSLLPHAAFMRFMETMPHFTASVTRLLATLAVETIERSGPLAWDFAPVRLGTILASLGRPDVSDPTRQRLEIGGLTQEDLAKMVGASRTWVGLTLAEFERHGLISKRRGRITITSARRFAGFIAAERNHQRFEG